MNRVRFGDDWWVVMVLYYAVFEQAGSREGKRRGEGRTLLLKLAFLQSTEKGRNNEFETASGMQGFGS